MTDKAPAARALDLVALVTSIKADLARRGVPLVGACGAFAITKRVAWALRHDGMGLLDKPGGNQCDGYATDIVMFPDGRLVDILGDGGGANTPMWNETGEIRPREQYRPAIDPGDLDVDLPPPSAPPTTGPPVDAATQVNLLRAELQDLKAVVDLIAAKQERGLSGSLFGYTLNLRPNT